MNAPRRQAWTAAVMGTTVSIHVIAAGAVPPRAADAAASTIAALRELAPDSDIRTGGAAMPSAPDIAEGPLRDVLPDVPFTPLRDGIARTFAFYRDGSL